MSDTAAIVLRRARAEESSLLTALALRSKAVWGYEEEFMRASAAELTVAPGDLVGRPAYVVEIEGRVAGFYVLEPLEGGDFELDLFFVEPDSIGRGYGGALFEHALRTAAALGGRRLVIQSDPNAEAFYVRNGARRVGSRPSASIPGRVLPLLEIDLISNPEP